jgi:hypothetical protein
MTRPETRSRYLRGRSNGFLSRQSRHLGHEVGFVGVEPATPMLGHRSQDCPRRMPDFQQHVPIHYQYRTYNNMTGVKTGSVGLVIGLQTHARLLLPGSCAMRTGSPPISQFQINNLEPKRHPTPTPCSLSICLASGRNNTKVQGYSGFPTHISEQTTDRTDISPVRLNCDGLNSDRALPLHPHVQMHWRFFIGSEAI